ncbi:hypothetical protein T552_01460 [Pneumocystis carinii B80]|uniref:DASH complex subunit DAD1 n=1 Tax=Pneumocystis carinii (strain B80) TaxID=1408658 RepID=A0A0W4ZKE0_PNEC8|nr:hypothetical protein T552_01460 [Pneumocystis carinii B80]KTW28831.1 hypothetical protein T552_01460 [Pneumocystis carinii B80]
MSSNVPANTETSGSSVDSHLLFEKQRDALIGQVAQSMEQIITNLNILNRNMESFIAVGKEFESVSTLWKMFHDVLSQEHYPMQEETQETEQNGEEGLV